MKESLPLDYSYLRGPATRTLPPTPKPPLLSPLLHLSPPT